MSHADVTLNVTEGDTSSLRVTELGARAVVRVDLAGVDVVAVGDTVSEAAGVLHRLLHDVCGELAALAEDDDPEARL